MVPRLPLNDMLALHESLCGHARKLMERKSHDYAGAAGDDTLANFTLLETLGVAPTEIGIYARLLDKIRRLSSCLTQDMAVDETMDDTIVDAINYLIILYATHKTRLSRSTD